MSNPYQTDKKFDELSEKTRRVLTYVMFNECLSWPVCRKKLRVAMKNDIAYSHEGDHTFLRTFLVRSLSPITEVDDFMLNEIWRVFMAKEVQRKKSKKLESQIDLSDKELVSIFQVREMLKPFGQAVFKEASGMFRVQPYAPMDPSRYYIRASRALATFQPRMIDKFHICKADVDKAIQIMRQNNVQDSSRLKIKLTDC